MGFEFSNDQNLQEMECHDFAFKALDSKRGAPARHKTSESDLRKGRRTAKMKNNKDIPSVTCGHQKLKDVGNSMEEKANTREQVPHSEGTQISLKKEILQLEKRLKNQFDVRSALEKALGYRSSMVDTTNDSLMPKPTKELIREIAVLELEVMHLEQYLLSLYRQAYNEQNSTLSPATEEKQKYSPSSLGKSLQEASRDETQSKQVCPDDQSRCPIRSKNTGMNSSCERSLSRIAEKNSGLGVLRCHSALSQQAVSSAISSEDVCFLGCSEKLSMPGAHRSYSALSHRAVYSALMSPHAEITDEDLFPCHSQPLSFLENGQNASSQLISLAECLGARIADHVPETPNRLSEDMVRCMGSIYCKLAEPPLVYSAVSSSPTSSFSSMSAISPQYLGDMWSPGCRKEYSFDARLENPFQLEGLKEFSGPYNAMIEVPSISTDSQRLRDVEDILKHYMSIMRRLEKADVRKMNNEEKLAFWINIHNAMVMHAYIHFGSSQPQIKRASLLLKATCNIGGRRINADIIQSRILGHHTHRPGQWFRTLVSPKLKLKVGNEWQAYATEHPETLLHFALCTGSHSDPAVRVYSPKRVFQQLETAKEEYIRAAVSIRKEQKILLPKILESYAKDSNMNPAETVEMIQHYMPETLRMAMQRCQIGRTQKCIEWTPHNFAFRYLLSRELAAPVIN